MRSCLDEKWRRTFELWSRKEEHQRLVQQTLENMRKITSKYRCVVSFSGGKDSTVMLHLALQAEPKVDVFHWDHGSWLMPREIENEIIENARAIGAQNLIIGRSELLEKPEIREKWGLWYLVFWNELHRLRREYGWEKDFVGLRKEEGCRRRSKILRHKEKWEVYPIADWSWLDVWAYIISNSIPYLKIYDKYAALLGYDKARLVTFFDSEFEKYGSPYINGYLSTKYRYSPSYH